MTAEELQDKITFRVEENAYHQERLVGRLVLHGQVGISPGDTNRSDVIDAAKKHVAELIMRHLYEDQRRELLEAIDELFLCHPTDFVAMSAARARINKAARLQPK